MLTSLKKYCSEITDFSEDELNLFDNHFEVEEISKKDFILKIGEVCNFIAFIDSGSVRHFHLKEGVEITCDISFDNQFITEFTSFSYGSKSVISIQALSDTKLFSIEKTQLLDLYSSNPKFEEFGRKMAEMAALRNSQVAMSLASDKPEERYRKLLKKDPAIFQKVQQKYIANLLGMTPESLSRIRKRTLAE